MKSNIHFSLLFAFISLTIPLFAQQSNVNNDFNCGDIITNVDKMDYTANSSLYVQCVSNGVESTMYYDLRPGIIRHFDNTSGFNPAGFDTQIKYHAGIERVLDVVQINDINWSKVEWIVYHSTFDVDYNLIEPTKIKQLYTTVTSEINYLRMEGSQLIQLTDSVEKAIFDFDIQLDDHIVDFTSAYVDLSESHINLDLTGSMDGTLIMDQIIEFPDQIARRVKWGDANSSQLPTAETFVNDILIQRDSWLAPTHNPTIYDAKLPYLQVEGFGVLFSPFTHRGLYLKGISTSLLDRAYTSGAAGTNVNNFASLPLGQPWNCGEEIRDMEGNRYRTVEVDGTCWMADNLTTATYKDGTPIQELREYDPWTTPNTDGNWAHYNNDTRYEDNFGKLYNGYAAIKGNGLCPVDWRVPTNDDWIQLRDHFGDSQSAGSILMTGSFFHWIDPGLNRIDTFNQSQFNATAGGTRSSHDGVFRDMKLTARWWTSTQTGEWENSSFRVDYQGRAGDITLSSRAWGLSVRCVFEQGYEVSIDEPTGIPAEFKLEQNYPNPFNPTTSISYSLPESATIKIEIYNVSGQLITTIDKGHQSAGRHSVQFDAAGLSSGVYFYRIQSDLGTLTQKMLLIK